MNQNIHIEKMIKKKVKKKQDIYEMDLTVSEYNPSVRVTRKNKKPTEDYSYYNDGNYDFEFSMSIDRSPICCGMSEMGDFEIDYDVDSKDIPFREKVKAIRELIKKHVTMMTGRSKKGETCITLYFTLLPDQDKEITRLIKSAIQGQNLFKKVKTFINQNTNNENELYISLNGSK